MVYRLQGVKGVRSQQLTSRFEEDKGSRKKKRVSGNRRGIIPGTSYLVITSEVTPGIVVVYDKLKVYHRNH